MKASFPHNNPVNAHPTPSSLNPARAGVPSLASATRAFSCSRSTSADSREFTVTEPRTPAHDTASLSQTSTVEDDWLDRNNTTGLRRLANCSTNCSLPVDHVRRSAACSLQQRLTLLFQLTVVSLQFGVFLRQTCIGHSSARCCSSSSNSGKWR